jgi:hypothetical protein
MGKVDGITIITSVSGLTEEQVKDLEKGDIYFRNN